MYKPFVAIISAAILSFSINCQAEAPALILVGSLTPEQAQHFEQQAIKGDKEAIAIVAAYHALFRRNYLTAAVWWRPLAVAGDLDGIYNHGHLLMCGEDWESAEKWLSLAKEKGHRYGANALRELEMRRAEKSDKQGK